MRRYAFAKHAHDAWASQCEQGTALPFEAFEVDRPSQQKTVAALGHARQIEALPQGSTRMRIFRQHMTLPEAKNWVQLWPSKTLRTLIKPQHFRTWMKYYCQVPLFQSRSKCPLVQMKRSWIYIYTVTIFNIARKEFTVLSLRDPIG